MWEIVQIIAYVFKKQDFQNVSPNKMSWKKGI